MIVILTSNARTGPWHERWLFRMHNLHESITSYFYTIECLNFDNTTSITNRLLALAKTATVILVGW